MIKSNLIKFASLIIAVMLVAAMLGITVFATSNEVPVLYVEDHLVQSGDTVVVKVFVEDNPGITNATLTLTVDEGLTLTNVEAGEAFSTLEFTAPENVGQANAYTFSWSGAEADASDGAALMLTFNVPANAAKGTVYDLDLSADGEYDIFDGQIEVIDYIPGDVDGNGEINGDDVTALRQYIAGGYGVTINEKAADVNNSGRINADDVTLVRQAIVGGYGVTLVPSTKCLEHTLTKVDAEAPTCTEDGNIEYWTCANCNKYYRDANGVKAISLERTVVEKLGHTLDLETLECKDCESGRLNGLYDANGKVVKTWEELLALGLNIAGTYSTDNTESTDPAYNASTDYTKHTYSGYSVLNQFDNGAYLVIPDDGSITAIGTYALAGCANLNVVYIPEGITSIGASAFRESGITSITIPESVTAYASYMLMNCTNLTNVNLNNRVSFLATQMMRGCTSLETITIPSVVNLIGNAVFKDCNNLKTVIVEGTLPRMGCKPGTNSVFTAEGIHLIINAAEVDMLADGKVNSTQRYSLDKYASHFTKITLGENVTSIQADVFENFDALESINFEGTTDEWTALNLGTAWYNGVELTKLTCTDGEICLHIFDGFAECTHEDCEYRLPAGLYDEEGKLLATWAELGIELNPETAYTADTYLTEATSGYAVLMSEAYKEMTGLTVVIPNEETYIGAYAFRGCTNVAQILASADTTYIGLGAFWSTGLTSFTIPENAQGTLTKSSTNYTGTYISANCFRDCKQLASITIPETITEVGGSAFYGCSKLDEVYFPQKGEKVKILGSAFRSCDGITLRFAVQPNLYGTDPFYESENVTIIIEGGAVAALSGNGAANFRKAVSKLVFGKGVTSIASGAFSESTGLESIEFEEGCALTTIGSKAFLDCTALNSVTFHDGLLSINAQAFAGCDSLTEITIPASVTTIQGNAFRYCDNLETVTFEDGGQLTALSEKAFYQCPKLTSIINIPATVTVISSEWVAGCSSLTTLTFAGTVEQWNAITKKDSWNNGIIATSITCSDGTACLHRNTTVLEAKDATCTETGLTAGTHCLDCNTDIVPQETVDINADAHNYTSEITTLPTCTTKGVKTYTCTHNAEHTYTEEVEIDANAHAWNEGVITKAPTCTTKGVKTYTCTHNAEHTYTEEVEIDADAHNYVSERTQAPTCADKGIDTYTCSNCGDTYTEEVPATGEHTPGEAVVENNVDPTCTAEGSYDSVVYCSVCMTHEISRTPVTVDALGHSFTNYVSNGDATCTKNGTETAKCDRCDVTDTREDEDSMLEHSFTNYVSNKDATCLEDGTKTATCDNCDATNTITDEGSALGHAWGETTYNFAKDGSACTATRACGREGCNATETANATITSAVKTPATGDTNGITTYTATFDVDWATTQTKDVDDIPAYGYTDPTIAIENVVVSGNYVTFDVSIRNNPGVMNMLLSMNINDDVFGFVGVERGEALPDAYLTASGSQTTNSPYKFLLDAQELNGETANLDGVIFTVTLEIKDADAEGTYDIEFSYVSGDISNGNLEAIEVDIRNNTIVLG